MGTYDPVGGATDDENLSGNILNAMPAFPTRFTFNFVGRTNGDTEDRAKYIANVKAIIEGGILSNDPDQNNEDTASNEGVSFSSNEVDLDKGIELDVKDRGKNFVKVSAEVTVKSAAVISPICESLSEMEATVMNF